MDWQTGLNIATLVLVPAVGYCVKEYRALEKAFTDFKIKVAEEYVTTHDLAEIKQEIREGFSKLSDKLDSKQDK